MNKREAVKILLWLGALDAIGVSWYLWKCLANPDHALRSEWIIGAGMLSYLGIPLWGATLFIQTMRHFEISKFSLWFVSTVSVLAMIALAFIIFLRLP